VLHPVQAGAFSRQVRGASIVVWVNGASKRVQTTTTTTGGEMATFALLLNHPPDRYTRLSEDRYMAVIKDYVAWVERATADGTYVGGHKLASAAGKTVTATADGINVHDSPFAELPEVLGGLMVIKAADYDAAIQIARHHPHLVHNTSMEIRQIDGAD
jgi:hypothetical protein